MIDVLVPVLGRGKALGLLVHSLAETTTVPWSLYFLCSPGDEETTEKCLLIAETLHEVSVRTVPWKPEGGDWAKKINLGYLENRAPFMLLGATDLRFHIRWDTEALLVAQETGGGVIGTNDLGNPTVMRGRHATHPLVRRSYVEEHGTIDEPGKVLHEGYDHQWVDNELVETAKARGAWAFAKNSHVEHLHPFWPDGKGGKKGEMDATYEKALSSPRKDMALFRSRRRLWLAR